MVEIVATSLPCPQQRPRSPNHDDGNDDDDASATEEVPKVPHNHHRGERSNEGINIILSLLDDRYRDVMWKQFNILGRVRDDSREENAALELWTQFKKEGAIFYREEESGGERTRLEEEDALEKIKSDIKRRTESVHAWLGKSHTLDSDISESSVDEAGRIPPPSSVDCVDPDRAMHSSAEQLSFRKCQRQQQRHTEIAPTNSVDAKIPPPINSLKGTSPAPNGNDTILSFHDAKYRDAMSKCFLELEKESSRSQAREKGRQLVFDFKMGGGRLFKMERGGKAYVEVDEAMALQKIMGDFGRRRTTMKRWNIGLANPIDGDKSSSAVGSDIHTSLPQGGEPKSCDINTSTVDLRKNGMVHTSAILSGHSTSLPRSKSCTSPPIVPQSTETEQSSVGTAAQPSCLECQYEIQIEEKKQDDHDLVSPNVGGNDIDHDGGPFSAQNLEVDVDVEYVIAENSKPVNHNGSSGECQEGHTDEKKPNDRAPRTPSAMKFLADRDGVQLSALKPGANVDIEPPSGAKPYVQSSSESNLRDHCGKVPSSLEKPKVLEASSQMVGSSPSRVILSLNDNYYRNIMLNNFRALGKAKDSDREAQIGYETFSLFKQQLGDSGRFFERIRDQHVEVNDEKALAKIIADIGRRMKNHQEWCETLDLPASRSAPQVKSPQPATPNRTMRGRHPKFTTSGNEKFTTNMTLKQSTQQHFQSDRKPSDGDVVLSLNDKRYKDVMWKKYNALGKKRLWDREEGVAKEIFQYLKESLGKGGRFWTKMSRSDLLFVVNDDGAFRKISRDLKKRNESAHKWLISDSVSQCQKQDPLPPHGAMSYYHPLPTKTHHAWQDQLPPSPVGAVTNYDFPEQTPPMHTNPLHTLGLDKKPPASLAAREKAQYFAESNNVHHYSPKPTHANKPYPKAINVKESFRKPYYAHRSVQDLLLISHIGLQLPPFNSSPTMKFVQTPNQLIQILQHATHKLNELHGTHVKHSKVLRLYNLPEFNGDSRSLVIEAPSLAKLAEFMETTPDSLKKWYIMYQHALISGFDFEKFGGDSINYHFGAFHLGKDYHRLSVCGEKVMETYFEQVILQNANNSRAAKVRGCRVKPRLKAARDNSTRPFNMIAEAPKAKKYRLDVAPHTENEQTTNSLDSNNEDHQLSGHRNSFPRFFQANTARLLEFRSSNDEYINSIVAGIQLSNVPKRIKKGTKDRMLCMVDGCERHSQARCDGCCSSHFRLLSSTDHNTKKPSRARAVYCMMRKLEAGSRIYVKWNADNNLYKATLKKTFFDREVPMVKVHYDGKKKHVLDMIPLKMVQRLIEGENRVSKEKQVHIDVLTQRGNAFTFSLLHKLYPAIVPLGENKITLPCPELGSKWKVCIEVKRGLLDGPRTVRYFVSPTGKRFRSVSEMEKYYRETVESEVISGDARKSGPKFVKRFDEECDEIMTVNKALQATQPESKLSMNSHTPENSTTYSQRGSKLSGTRSLITISPITTVPSSENHQLPIRDDRGQGQGEVSTIKPITQSQKEVAAVNIGVHSKNVLKKNTACSNSAFTSTGKTARHPLHYQFYPTSPAATDRAEFSGMRDAIVGRPTRTTLGRVSEGNEKLCNGRPKRKLKPIARFDEEDSPPSRRVAHMGQESKSVRCHCPECDKGDLSVQGIYAHYGRAHKGNLPWQNVTFSCPFCLPTRTASSRIFQSFHDIQAHVSASHPGCEAVGPHPSKLSGKSNIVNNDLCEVESKSASKIRQDIAPKSDRVLRERKAISESPGHATESALQLQDPEVVTEKQYPPSWTKIGFQTLLPDGRKDYSRDLSRVLDMIDGQCESQAEIVEIAREQRMKLCRSEAETENRALDEERLSFQRGIRERARLVDAERIEKQKFTEKAEHMMIRFQYENRNKRRNQEDIEVEKLCSRPIKFCHETQRHNTRQGKACADDQCQFCKKDKGYLHHLLLDSEMDEFKMDAPATESPVFQKSIEVLNPVFRTINDDYLTEAEAADDLKEDAKQASGNKRVNQSRRDVSTSKRVKVEEDKLLLLKNTKHSLEFIKEYNNGMINNAWGEARKDSRSNRKLY